MNLAYYPPPHYLATHNQLNGSCLLAGNPKNSVKFAKRTNQLSTGLTPVSSTFARFLKLKIAVVAEIFEPDYCLLFSERKDFVRFRTVKAISEGTSWILKPLVFGTDVLFPLV